MQSSFDLDDDISPSYLASLERQIRFKFTSFESDIQAIRGGLERDVVPIGGSEWFVCRLEVQMRDGSTWDVETRGAQPQICIADAASRLHRKLARRVTLRPGQPATRAG